MSNIKHGMRIPKSFFITSGYGESDNTLHAGSYHIMLNMMGIAGQNIMNYSSVLPANCIEIEKPNWLYKSEVRGAVMEVIMSSCNGRAEELLSAGIIYAYTYEDEEMTKCTGGLVCEINGSYSDESLEYKLQEALKEIYNNGFSHEYLGSPTIIKKSFTPELQYGSVGVALCFIDYE
jgi:arginine decarboxylase